MTRPWQPGETIVVQEVWRGRLWAARPMFVVHDAGDSLALWFPHGTVWKTPTTPPTRERAPTRGERLMACLALEDWVIVDREWDVSTLCLVEAGASHAVWCSWLPDGSPFGWYINLQDPFRRTERGIQTMDLMLDVVVDPDGAWRWKDEDEFQGLLDHGLITPARAAEVRAEAESVIARLEAGEAPFCDPWPDWRPDPSWGLPSLPPGWDEV